MSDGRKNLKLQPEDHAELKRRKPDDKSFVEWLLEATEDYSDERGQSESTVSNEDIWNRLDGIGDDIGTLKDSISGQPRH